MNQMRPNNIGLRRYLECAGFILVWMVIGSLFQLGGGGYLLLGIPLLLIFQIVVARRQLHELWVRDAKSFSLDFKLLATALALITVPLLIFIFRVRDYGTMYLVIAVGAFPCAFTLRKQRVDALLKALPLFGLSAVIGCSIFAAFAISGGRSMWFGVDKVPVLLADIYCLTLAGFLVEEVVFRGGLDGHLASNQPTIRRQLISAVFVSFLWGIWHLPLAYLYPSREPGFLALAIALNVLWGVPLSLCCRKSGTLLLPALVHAVCDAYRNVLSL